MKKVMILAVIAAIAGLSVSVSVSAQTPSSTPDEQGVQETQGTQSTGSQSTGSQGVQGTQGSQGTGSQSASQYSEMKTMELPASVSTSISEKYPGYKTEKAYRGKDGSYKVTVSKDNDKQTLFFDQKGESIKMQK